MNRVISTDDRIIPASAVEPGLVSHVSSLGRSRVNGGPDLPAVTAAGGSTPHFITLSAPSGCAQVTPRLQCPGGAGSNSSTVTDHR